MPSPSLLEADRVFRISGNLADALSAIETSGVRATLQSLLANDEELTRLSSLSYSHPNGFAKLVLYENAGFKVVCHAWNITPSSLANWSDLHNHRWWFCSSVMTGSITVEDWTISPDGEQLFAYEYRSPSGGNAYPRQAIGEQRAMKLATATLAAGTKYELSPDVFHRVIAPHSQPTVTVAVQAPPTRQTSTVLLTTATPAIKIQFVPYNPQSYSQVLESVIGALPNDVAPTPLS